jgi:tRNA G18 (ribose-2'-O)-methylase SpoU
MSRPLQQIGSSHPAIRQVLQLQRNQAAEDDTLTVAEGLWAHQTLSAEPVRIAVFLWCPEALRGPEAVAVAERIKARAEKVYQISARTLDRLSGRDKPDGLISVIAMPEWEPGQVHLGETALVLVADGIEQPGNLGTLVRTLDACGADCLVLTDTRTRRTNIKVFRASHGTILRVPTLSFEHTPDAMNWLDELGFQVYLADTEGAVRYSEVPFAARTAIVMGNERFGISRDWYRGDAVKVHIPMLGVADSLNVSISAAVLLYEARSRLDRWRG